MLQSKPISPVMFEKTQNTQWATTIWRTKHIFERLSLKNKQGAQQAYKKEPLLHGEPENIFNWKRF